MMNLETIKDFFVTQYKIIMSHRFGIIGAVIILFFASWAFSSYSCSPSALGYATRITLKRV